MHTDRYPAYRKYLKKYTHFKTVVFGFRKNFVFGFLKDNRISTIGQCSFSTTMHGVIYKYIRQLFDFTFSHRLVRFFLCVSACVSVCVSVTFGTTGHTLSKKIKEQNVYIFTFDIEQRRCENCIFNLGLPNKIAIIIQDTQV